MNRCDDKETEIRESIGSSYASQWRQMEKAGNSHRQENSHRQSQQ